MCIRDRVYALLWLCLHQHSQNANWTGATTFMDMKPWGFWKVHVVFAPAH